MAEIVVFVKSYAESSGHWMDQAGELELQQLKIDANYTLTIAERIEAKERFTKKFAAHQRPGDIVGVEKNGWWDWLMVTNPKNRVQEVYGAIRVPGTVKELACYACQIMDRTDELKPKLVRKYRNNVAEGWKLGEVVEMDSVRICDHEDEKEMTIGGIISDR